jgi:hypothetical protein
MLIRSVAHCLRLGGRLRQRRGRPVGGGAQQSLPDRGRTFFGDRNDRREPRWHGDPPGFALKLRGLTPTDSRQWQGKRACSASATDRRLLNGLNTPKPNRTPSGQGSAFLTQLGSSNPLRRPVDIWRLDRRNRCGLCGLAARTGCRPHRASCVASEDIPSGNRGRFTRRRSRREPPGAGARLERCVIYPGIWARPKLSE